MLPSLSRGLRLALVLALSVGYVAWHGHHHAAFAKGGDGDDKDGDDGDDAKDTGDDNADDSDEQGEEDKDQPAVTAGGLFTINTYPVNEILRPLTLTKGIAQLRLSLGTDLSDKGAFDTGGVSLEAQYGLTDNFTLLGGVTDAYNFNQFSVYAGFEGALAYDLLDIRVAANLHRNAIPQYALFCDPGTTPNEMPVNGACTNSMASQDSLPTGVYGQPKGDVRFSLDLGFPLRYAFKPEIAIVALQTLVSIDFYGVKNDHVLFNTTMGAAGNPVTTTQTAGNSAKPDLEPSLGVAINPVPALSVVIFGQLRVPDFDTAAGAFQVPVTGRVEFSPNQKFDIGLEFTLLNVMPPEGQSPITNRFLSLFVQSRIGK